MNVRSIARSLMLTLVFVAGCSSFGGSSDNEPMTGTPPSEVETERAVAALRRMSDFLASRPVLRFEVDIQYDAIQASGQKVEFGSQRQIALRRPDRMRVEVLHWDGTKELVTFDGHRLSASIFGGQVYASVEYAGTTTEAFDHLVSEYDVATPIADLLRRDLPEYVASRALSAQSLGTITVAGTRCEHLIFRGQRIDFQLFIEAGEEPVPVRFVIDYHAEPGSPQFRAQLRNYDWQSELTDSLFRLLPLVGAQRVEFGELLDLTLGQKAER